ncbi:glutaminyl-peptide cyclotransferase [Spirosoma foliorum]|uniref:Glutaminyl-peptide cyclotransferase n=1 Tax=Spirosoma foliorum TaxID=2710596 RepID=A0A7G5H281_9BACT|nr:glutaminyl-peptide cyclotransferase [Spirosoma foliorum]QMW05223.1 glutaminyl-peptide cyclotransferase [Spirosoma foliorum]
MQRPNKLARYRFLFIALLGLSVLTCKQKKEQTTTTEDTKQPIASLTKSTYTLGDTITIQLSQPLSEATVSLDDVGSPLVQKSATSLSIHTGAEKIGLHQLVVRGKTANNTVNADTLSVEFWSDINPRSITYTVLKTLPHQSSSFTQGLEFYKGTLYESTGLNSQSKLMQIDLATGSTIKSVSLDSQYFGEGITILNDRIYQLTWTSGVCFQYTMDFKLAKTFAYPTQGWGLTHTDSVLIQSDGSNKLYFLSPDFQRKGELVVYDNMGPVMNLNELEYVNGYVYANVWQTNRIVQIDIKTGKVVGNLNMEGIRPTNIDKENVLNGIAFQPTENAFYVTGKNWPTLTKIQLKSKDKKLVASR